MSYSVNVHIEVVAGAVDPQWTAESTRSRVHRVGHLLGFTCLATDPFGCCLLSLKQRFCMSVFSVLLPNHPPTLKQTTYRHAGSHSDVFRSAATDLTSHPIPPRPALDDSTYTTTTYSRTTHHTPDIHVTPPPLGHTNPTPPRTY